MIGFIRRQSNEFSDPYTLKTLYVSLVRSILEYASVVWSPNYQMHINRIESVQKVFTRFALRKLNWQSDLPPYEVRCKLIDIQKLSVRRKILSIMFTRDILSGDIDSPDLLALVGLYAPSRIIRTRDMLFTPIHRTNYGYRDPLSVAITLFNKFCIEIDFTLPKVTFKRLVANLIKD